MTEELYKINRQNINIKPIRRSNKSILLVVFTLTLLIGFALGKSYSNARYVSIKNIYVLDETKLLKLVSIGVALNDIFASQKNKINNQHTAQNTLTELERNQIKESIAKLDHILKYEYAKHPILIEKDKQGQNKKNSRGYEFYGSKLKRIDITQEVIIKLIGKKRWELIGESFK